ncbi:3'-5' exonuclease [Burkholderia ambifaria]
MEERRLFYFAVTRARKQLYLFHAPFYHAHRDRSLSNRLVCSIAV